MKHLAQNIFNQLSKKNGYDLDQHLGFYCVMLVGVCLSLKLWVWIKQTQSKVQFC